MKKLLTTILCLVLSFCIVLAVGCNDGKSITSAVFNGDYVEVKASDITAFNQSVAQTEKALDITKGVKFEYVENEIDDNEYEKENVSFKTAIVDGKLLLAGTTSEDEKDDGKTFTENCEVYYDGETLYLNNIGLAKKESRNVSLITYFNRAMQQLNRFTLDNVVARYSNLNGVKFYQETTDGLTKIKLEFENIEDHDEKTTGKILFTYDAQMTLVAINVEVIEQELGFGDNEYEEIIINIEAWNGEITLPTDLGAYTENATLNPW